MAQFFARVQQFSVQQFNNNAVRKARCTMNNAKCAMHNAQRTVQNTPGAWMRARVCIFLATGVFGLWRFEHAQQAFAKRKPVCADEPLLEFPLAACVPVVEVLLANDSFDGSVHGAFVHRHPEPLADRFCGGQHIAANAARLLIGPWRVSEAPSTADARGGHQARLLRPHGAEVRKICTHFTSVAPLEGALDTQVDLGLLLHSWSRVAHASVCARCGVAIKLHRGHQAPPALSRHCTVSCSQT